jgi:membrane-bound serine protease (ClpP class)
MVNNDAFDFEFVPANELLIAVGAAFGGLLGGIAVLFIGGARISNSKLFKRIALMETQDREQGYTSSFVKEPMKGKTGLAYTVLRPSGKVIIDGQLYDAFTRGEYIDKDQQIEVVDEETTSLKVKKI